MKLSIQSIYIKLAKKYQDVRLHHPPPVSFQFSSVRILLEQQKVWSEETLYLCDSKEFLLQEDHCYIVTESVVEKHKNITAIVLPDTTCFLELFHKVLSIFEWFQGFSNALHEAIIKGTGLQEILELVDPYFESPIYIADTSFKMLAKLSKDMEEMSVIWRYQYQYGYLPYYVIGKLLETGEMDLLNHTKQAIYVDSKSFTRNFISKALYHKGSLAGHFFVIEVYHHLNQCDLDLAEYFGNVLSAASYSSDHYLKISSYYHEHFMLDILEYTLTDETLISNQLQPLGWTLEGFYQILVLPAKKNETAGRYLMRSLTQDLDAQSFHYQEYLIIVVNRKEKITINQLEKRIQTLGFLVGQSECFTRFDKMAVYYKQALFALNKGEEKNKKGFVFYEDCFFDHLYQLTKEDMLCYQPVEQLIWYDKKHHTNYCETLYYYLINERNAVKTASQLFLHRNTMKYRLEKIEQLICVDLEHPLIRSRILLSLFPIVKKNEKTC